MSRARALRLARLGAGVALALCALAGAGAAIARPAEMATAVNAFLEAVRGSGPFGIGVFLFAQVLVALSGVLPASLLGAAAGAIYGLEAGFAVAAVSTLLGAQFAFVAARSLLRGFAERALSGRPRLRELDQMIAGDGWRLVCLLRMSPVMPFSATSYALGLSSVSAFDYAVGTLAAMPALFGYVLIGTLTENGLSGVSTGASPLRMALLALGLLATAALTLRFGQIVRRAGFIGGLGHTAGG